MILDIGPVRFQERVLWYTARELIFQPKLVRKERETGEIEAPFEPGNRSGTQ